MAQVKANQYIDSEALSQKSLPCGSCCEKRTATLLFLTCINGENPIAIKDNTGQWYVSHHSYFRKHRDILNDVHSAVVHHGASKFAPTLHFCIGSPRPALRVTKVGWIRQRAPVTEQDT
jgi:hypothetical protein